MKVTNRKTVRKAVQASIAAALVGPSKVAQACYAYQTGEFDMALSNNDVANLAIYVIVSDGADRQNEDSVTVDALQTVFLALHSFVLYEKEGEWTEEESEDKIDDMEAGFIEWLSLNEDRRDENEPAWLQCQLIGRSTIDSVFLAGIEYRHERFLLAFNVGNPE